MLFEELDADHLSRAPEWLDQFSDKATRQAAEAGWRVAMAKLDPIAAIDIAASTQDRWNANEIRSAAIAEQRGRAPVFYAPSPRRSRISIHSIG
jgi:hypothetical protein